MVVFLPIAKQVSSNEAFWIGCSLKARDIYHGIDGSYLETITWEDNEDANWLFKFNGKTITEIGGTIPICGIGRAPLYGWKPIVTDTMILLDCNGEEEKRTVVVNRVSGKATYENHFRSDGPEKRWMMWRGASLQCRKLQQAF